MRSKYFHTPSHIDRIIHCSVEKNIQFSGEHLNQLTDNDLKELGVVKIGHRLAIKSVINSAGEAGEAGKAEGMGHTNNNVGQTCDNGNVRLPPPSPISQSLDHNTQEDAKKNEDKVNNNYKKRNRRRTDPKVRTMSSVIVLDPFLTGEVEFRNYLTISHANSLFKNLLNLPFEDHHKNRSSLWYGCMDYVYSKVSIKSRGPLSSLRPLHQLGNRLSKDLGCDFNSCLVNFYKDGSDSCGWHADDEGIFGENPTIASISLGCTRQFQLMPIPGTLFSKNCTTFFDLTLRHGDLIVMKGDVQKYWHHCVPRQAGKCTARINLTFRHVVTRSS